MVGLGMYSSGLGYGQLVCFCEQGNEASNFIKCS